MFADIIVRCYIEVFELQKQQVSSNVYGYLLSQLAGLKKELNFSDHSVYMGVKEFTGGLLVRPSVHTALPLAVLCEYGLCSLDDDTLIVPESTLRGKSLKLGKSFAFLCDARLTLLYRNIAEILLCGYQASLVTHKRFEMAMERIKQIAQYQVLSGYRQRYVDLSRFLEDKGFNKIASCISRDGFDTLHTNTFCAGMQLNKVIFNFLRQVGWITDITKNSFKFLGDNVESSDDLTGALIQLSNDEMDLIRVCVLLACSSKSLDPIECSVSSRPVAIIGSGEVLEE